jgi:serine/threonine protein kinase
MNATDVLVLEYLAAHAGFADHQIAHLKGWWGAAAGDESLTEFLHRQGLISRPTVQIFGQVAAGFLTRHLGFTLLDRAELERLRLRLPELVGSGDAEQTMTLLGDDTAKETAAPAGEPGPPQVGGRLGKYLLTEWVGQGASGSVFRALHPTLHIPVAVKVLTPGTGDDQHERVERLKSEAQLLAQLNHPNIVRVYDFEGHSRYPFLVLELVNGPTLAELIAQSGRIQPDRVVRIVRQLSDGLAAAHQLGIVHRDIKPANVLLTRGGDVKLADLGLATVRAPFAAPGPMPDGSRVGTACYIAPELVGSMRPADERSDMYSLGATFYHALTGRPPFEGSAPWQVIEQHAKAPRPCPRERVPDLPADIAELVVRMLAREPDARPTSFKALLQEPALNRSSPDSPAFPSDAARARTPSPSACR